MRWKRKQKNLQQARESYSAVHPDVDLTEIYDRAGRPDHWDDPETEFSDEFDLLHEAPDNHQDDETGIVAGDTAPDPWQQRAEAFHQRMALTEASDQIMAKYEAQLRPYREAVKRNPGVKPVAMGRLEQARDEEIRELTREHHLAEAYRMAEQDRPGRMATAHERAIEKAAARSFAMDLGRGRHLRDDPADAGRDVHDAWVW
jgi:hypothetical protein